jgi:polyisoprenoid-binding protein YceI
MATPEITRTALPTGTWVVDPAHTVVGFTAKHAGVSTVRGQFRDFDGRLEVSDLGIAVAWGSVRTASVDTGVEVRDEHLRSADFFEVDTYPEMEFVSRSIEPGELDDEAIITGDLTIRGITKEIVLRAEIAGPAPDHDDNLRVGLSITGQLSRRDYGMRFNHMLGGGNALVGDRIKLVLDVSAVRQEH